MRSGDNVASGRPSNLCALMLAAALCSLLAAMLGVPFAFAADSPPGVGSESASTATGASDSPDEAEAGPSAEELSALTESYLAAVEEYRAALELREQNTQAIQRVEDEIGEAESQLSKSQAHLEEASIEMYKNGIQPGELLESVLAAPSLSESATLYDDYMRLEAHRRQQCEDARTECEALKEGLAELEAQRDELSADVIAARQAVCDAKDALRKASHLDGEGYHQVQRNGVNCGATAFTVGVNILLGEKRFTDNEKVWSSEAFGCDSTTALVEKGRAWLADNELDDVIDFQYVKGDIHVTDELREELEKGGVVVISSGSGSEWQRVDKADAQKGLYPGGHWICFYGYSEGIFYANDSAVSAKRGAGCPYTEKQMQQWLDGRSYHVACVLTSKVSHGDAGLPDAEGQA